MIFPPFSRPQGRHRAPGTLSLWASVAVWSPEAFCSPNLAAARARLCVRRPARFCLTGGGKDPRIHMTKNRRGLRTQTLAAARQSQRWTSADRRGVSLLLAPRPPPACAAPGSRAGGVGLLEHTTLSTEVRDIAGRLDALTRHVTGLDTHVAGLDMSTGRVASRVAAIEATLSHGEAGGVGGRSGYGLVPRVTPPPPPPRGALHSPQPLAAAAVAAADDGSLDLYFPPAQGVLQTRRGRDTKPHDIIRHLPPPLPLRGISRRPHLAQEVGVRQKSALANVQPSREP